MSRNAPARQGQAQGAQLVVANKQTLRAYLDDARFKQQLAAVLPKHLTPDRMAALAFLACTQTPKLLECTPISIVRAVMAASITGLEFNGPLGHAYLVPYGPEASFIPGYRGLIDLVVRGGGAHSVDAHIVYPGDEFDIELGNKPRLYHKPDWKARAEVAAEVDKDPSVLLMEIVGAYMVALLPTGEPKFDFMPQHEIMRRRRMSRATRDDSPWKKWPDEMVRKAPVRHGIKFLPISNERLQQRLGAALEFDNRFESGEVSGFIPEFDDAATLEASIQEATAARAENLREQLEAKAAAAREKADAEKAGEGGESGKPVAGAPDFNGSNYDALPPEQKAAVDKHEADLFGRKE